MCPATNVSWALLRIFVLNSIFPSARTLMSVWPFATDVEPVVSFFAASFACSTHIVPWRFFAGVALAVSATARQAAARQRIKRRIKPHSPFAYVDSVDICPECPNSNLLQMQLRDISPGLWIWRREHPDWTPEMDWQPLVTSTCVESGGEVAVLDPLAPPEDADEIWARLDEHPPTLVVVLKPDHVRDVDTFVRRYHARPYGPALFWRDDVPETELEPIEPGSELPGGLVALYDGRGRNETPLWLPEQRALVFADALTAPEGELRVWESPAHEERALALPPWTE